MWLMPQNTSFSQLLCVWVIFLCFVGARKWNERRQTEKEHKKKACHREILCEFMHTRFESRWLLCCWCSGCCCCCCWWSLLCYGLSFHLHHHHHHHHFAPSINCIITLVLLFTFVMLIYECSSWWAVCAFLLLSSSSYSLLFTSSFPFRTLIIFFFTVFFLLHRCVVDLALFSVTQYVRFVCIHNNFIRFGFCPKHAYI